MDRRNTSQRSKQRHRTEHRNRIRRQNNRTPRHVKNEDERDRRPHHRTMPTRVRSRLVQRSRRRLHQSTILQLLQTRHIQETQTSQRSTTQRSKPRPDISPNEPEHPTSTPHLPRHPLTPHHRTTPMTAPDIPYRKWLKLRKLILIRDPQCVYCGAQANTVDHVLPTKHGGLSTIDNLVGACKRCNYSKGARTAPQGQTTGIRSSKARRTILSSQPNTPSSKDKNNLPIPPQGISLWRLTPKKGK